MVSPPPCLETLLHDKVLRDLQFEEDCKTLQTKNLWAESLCACFTQHKTWRGGWDQNGCPFPDSLLTPLLDQIPSTIEKIEQGKHHLLTSLVPFEDDETHEIPYHVIHGDISSKETPFHTRTKPLSLLAPNLLEVRGNLNLENYNHVFLPKLQRVWGSLSLSNTPIEAPQLTVVGGDLVDENSETQLQNLLACGGSFCLKKDKNPCLPSLQWVGKSLRLSESQTLSASLLRLIGRELLAPKLTRLVLPNLQSCPSLQTRATSCFLPQLTHCHFLDPSLSHALPLSCLHTLLHQKVPPPPTLKKTLSEQYEKKLRKIHSLQAQQIGL